MVRFNHQIGPSFHLPHTPITLAQPTQIRQIQHFHGIGPQSPVEQTRQKHIGGFETDR